MNIPNRVLWIIVSILCIAAMGCTVEKGTQKQANFNGNSNVNSNSSVADVPSEPGDNSPEAFEGTAGLVEGGKPGAEVATMADVRSGGHPKFDRLVFEFKGEVIPPYHVEYIDSPVRQCGSGEAVEIAGDGWLQIKFNHAQAHTEAGEPTIRDRSRHTDLQVIKEIELTCDYEADVTWVLGVAAPNRYRALELSNPPRLVIDVRH